MRLFHISWGDLGIFSSGVGSFASALIASISGASNFALCLVILLLSLARFSTGSIVWVGSLFFDGLFAVV